MPFSYYDIIVQVFKQNCTSETWLHSDKQTGVHCHVEISCIRPYLDSKTASTIVASIVHSKLDYCNSLSTTIFINLK